MLCIGMNVDKRTVGTHMRTWRMLTDRSSAERREISPLDPAFFASLWTCMWSSAYLQDG
jgi:hypothetical protein